MWPTTISRVLKINEYMYRSFGRKKQVECPTAESYYELLGYLAKSDGSTKIVWEHNEAQGAWGSEGRIHFMRPIPALSATLKHTAGVGAIVSRVNCNGFVEHIVDNHNFTNGTIQDIAAIRATIPSNYITDFEKGLLL